MKILVATVGGSLQPIITSITQSKPDRIYFLCSQQSKRELDGICNKAKVADMPYESEIINGIDDLNECYACGLKLLDSLRNEFPDAEIIADYTGGTKSMGAGLAAAALDVKGIRLGLVTGSRFDLKQVTDGTQSLRTSQAVGIQLERRLQTISNCFKTFDYPTAISWLEETLQLPDVDSEKTVMLQRWLTLASALDNWDKFDHTSAWNLLHNYRARYTKLVMFLEVVVWSRKKLDPDFAKQELPRLSASPKGHGYEVIEDLFLNAQRCAAQHRFDDAVARLYRALELLAQARLRLGYSIDTGDLSLKLLPQELQGEYRKLADSKGKIKLPLTPAFDLLAKLTDFYTEPLGTLYKQYRGQLRDFLSIRNQSLLAHGLTPVQSEDYDKANSFFVSLIDGAFEALNLKPYALRTQFPTGPEGDGSCHMS